MKTSSLYRSGRLYLVVTCVLLWFGVLTGRLVQLHVIDRPELLEQLESNRRRVEVVDGRRGNIVDRRGHLMATTRSLRNVGVDPQEVRKEDREKWPQLADILGLSLVELESRMEQRYQHTGEHFSQEISPIRWNVLKKGVEEEDYRKLMDLKVRGVYGNRVYERNYPNGQLAAHLIGFINREEQAVQGLEQWMDFYLRGQNGWRESERDGRRREVRKFRSREIQAVDGLNVELTVDLVIQNAIEREIDLIVEQWAPQGVTIIVSEPKTGDILGMASYPGFDPNRFWEYSLDQHRNRAITDVYEPGSTFKVVTLAAALNEGVVTPETQFDCSANEGTYKGRLIRLPRNSTHRDYGMMSVREIAMKSLNNGSALIGMTLGAQKMYDYARAFGFGTPTGFPMTGEVRGILHPISSWDGLTISRLPIGHAISVTPLQTHYAMSVIANRGVLMKPRVVRRILDRQGQSFLEVQPEIRQRVISEKTAEIMASMLVDVVGPQGTAPRAVVKDYEVAGKTGTTQKIIQGRYSSQHHIGSFVGFFPASDPRLVISVIVDDPRGSSGYGGVVAAPSFQHLANFLIQYMRIPPPEPSGEWIAWKGEF